MAAVEPVGQSQDDDFSNDDEDYLYPSSSYRSANSSFCSSDSYRSENSEIDGPSLSLSSWESRNSYIGAPDIEERTNSRYYAMVFPSTRKDFAADPQRKSVDAWWIPKPHKFLPQLGRVKRKSSAVPTSHSPFSRTESSTSKTQLPVVQDVPFSRNETSTSTIQLPVVQDVPITERKRIFLENLELCCIMYDFTDVAGKLEEKEVKRKALLELNVYVNSADAMLDEEEIKQSIKMVSINLFRPLPRSNLKWSEAETYRENQTGLSKIDLLNGEEQFKSMSEPSWSHMELVYEFLLGLVESDNTDTKLAVKYIDRFFLLRLLDLFDHQDSNEREHVKNVIQQIYDKFTVHRPFLRRVMNSIICELMDGTEGRNGIADLLDVLGFMIDEFVLPLKEEHRLTLFRVLIPLHKSKTLFMYSASLTYCIKKYVEKDPTLVAAVISGLLKNWPRADWSKEVFLLEELEEVLECIQPEYADLHITTLLFSRVARCIQNSHHKVAEQGLILCKNSCIIDLILQYQSSVLPIIYPALERNTRAHWNKDVMGLSANVKKMLYNIDHDTFAACQKKFQEEEAKQNSLKPQDSLGEA